MGPREIQSYKKGTSGLADTSGNGDEIAAWAKEWNERNAHLLQLVEGFDRGGLDSAVELLQEVRECRRRLADPPDPKLRNCWRRALDEIWEAACSTLYGDLGPARQHTDAALGSIQEMRGILKSCAD
jgi:hypothetical protein